MAVTVQPLRASQIASAPSPQPTSSARPGVRLATSARSRPFGRPLHLAPSRSLYLASHSAACAAEPDRSAGPGYLNAAATGTLAYMERSIGPEPAGG